MSRSDIGRGGQNREAQRPDAEKFLQEAIVIV